MGPVVVRVPIARSRAHAQRMRSQHAVATAVAALVLAATLPFSMTSAPELVTIVIGFVRMVCILSMIATARLGYRLGAAPETDALEVVIDEGEVTVVRGDRVLFEHAALVHATAFPDWIMLTVDTGERARFAVPVDADDRARLLDAVPRAQREEASRFLGWWAAVVVGITAVHLVVHVVVVMSALALAFAMLALPLLVGQALGPTAGALAFLVFLAALLVAAAVSFARWVITGPGRAALRGLVVALSLDVVHAAGWALYVALAAPTHGSDALQTFGGVATLGVMPALPWGMFVGMMSLARPTWSRATFVALAAAPMLALLALMASTSSMSTVATGLPALALAAIGGWVLAPAPR